ncbi:MAG: hypothetical protein VX579_04160 [Nitrospinota bacterium]|nr:hypothetical protein [Nitrospinota bacterium]
MRATITKTFLNLFIMLLGVVVIENGYATDKCKTFKVNFNNQINKIFKNINLLKTCIKPASKYRLQTCVKRKQEGSKGFNCMPELTAALNSNKKNDCEVRFNNIRLSLKQLSNLDQDNDFCLKLGKK